MIEFIDNPKNDFIHIEGKRNETTCTVIALSLDADRSINVRMKPHESSRLFTILLLSCRGKASLTVHTHQEHVYPFSTSDLLCKSILTDAARFHFEGTIAISKKGEHSHAYQKNENLLLGDEARVVSEPKLEIEANEVFCTHGATTGCIGEEEQFYLGSRGLSPTHIDTIITEGFLLSGLQKLAEAGIPLTDIENLYGRLRIV